MPSKPLEERISSGDLTKMVKLRREGLKYTEIAKHFSLHYNTVMYHLGAVKKDKQPQTKVLSDSLIKNEYALVPKFRASNIKSYKNKFPEFSYKEKYQQVACKRFIRDKVGNIVKVEKVPVKKLSHVTFP